MESCLTIDITHITTLATSSLKLHGPMISKYFKTKAITYFWSYISNLDISTHLLIGAEYKE